MIISKDSTEVSSVCFVRSLSDKADLMYAIRPMPTFMGRVDCDTLVVRSKSPCHTHGTFESCHISLFDPARTWKVCCPYFSCLHAQVLPATSPLLRQNKLSDLEFTFVIVTGIWSMLGGTASLSWLQEASHA